MVTLKSSIHQPTPPFDSLVPSRNRSSTQWSLKDRISAVACTQPPLSPLHACLPASGFWFVHPTIVCVYPPDRNDTSAQVAPPSMDASSRPPSNAAEPSASKLYLCQ